MESLRQIFTTFGVTWPTFLAQVLTVGIVYWVLKRYAFGPITAILEERRKRIAEGQANAEKIKRELAEAEKRYREMLEKANSQAQKLIEEARQSSGVVAQKQLHEASLEAGRILKKAHEATQLEHARVLAELKQQVGRLVVETTEKVTRKTLSPDDQKRLEEEALQEIAS